MHSPIDIDNVENVGEKKSGSGGRREKKREWRDINLQVVNGGTAAVASELSLSPLWKHHQH